MNLTGNTILITGGTSGIGRALAEALHKKGNEVIVSGRRQHLLDEVKASNPGIKGIAVDMEKPESIDAFAKRISTEFPKLNVLVNNAGIARLEDYTADAVDLDLINSTIQTNILGVLQLTARLLPTLRAQPKSTLITTTSGLAFVPYAPGPVYGATKAFLHNWLEALRYQLRKTSVEVLELAPPYVQTELGGEGQKTDPRAMPLAEFTAEVVSILSNPPASGEILVERVLPLRWAEKNGNYQQIFQQIAGMH